MEDFAPGNAEGGAQDESTQALAEQVLQLKNELEAARIERDQFKAATVTMSQALEQMNDLLRDSRNLPNPESNAEG